MNATPSPIIDGNLIRDGFCIVRQALATERVAQMADDLEPQLKDAGFCIGGFYGERTKRIGGLLARSAVAAEMALCPEVMALSTAVLSPYCDTLQLNLTQAVAIHPGAPSQFPHRDQDMWRGETGRIEYLVNVIWPLTPFTPDNGATRVWPGSHGRAALAPVPNVDPVPLRADPGDAILFLGSTLHGGGANISPRPRTGVIVSYCLGWLKPYENQWLVYPPAIARTFPSALQQLVGYQQHRPNLGNVEGQCPSLLLRGGPGPSATDALRPDQAALLAEYLREQAASPHVSGDAG